MMEENTFRQPAVAEKLEERYVEARIHTDSPDHPENMDFALEMTGSVALPIYLILDPETDIRYGRLDGALEDEFVMLLDRAWEDARGDKQVSAR